MNNYVFDTNSIISAHLLPSSMNRRAYNLALETGILLHSKETLDELKQVFFRPKFDKYISSNERGRAIEEFEKKSFHLSVSVIINSCRDPKDNKFLELALSGSANFIITGDKDLLELHPFRNISILTAGDFLKAL